MTDAERQYLKNFDAKVRSLIASYVALKEENAKLYKQLKDKDEDVRLAMELAEQYKKDYDNLKLAKMIEISDGDFKNAKQRITYLVREINACINMLNAQ